jgi:hypothetical protein
MQSLSLVNNKLFNLLIYENLRGGAKISEESNAKHFDWQLYPEQENFQKELVKKFLRRNRFALDLADRIEKHTRTSFVDWIDHMVLPENNLDMSDIIKMNYKEKKDLELPPETRSYHIPKSTLFPILLHPKDSTELVIGCDNIRDYKKTWSLQSEITGQEDAPYNLLEIVRYEDNILHACERRGYNGFLVKDPKDLDSYHEALDFFQTRERETEEHLTLLEDQIKNFSSALDNGRMADAFFRAERIFWIERNSAGRYLKKLQDDVGLGWGNRDHQAFRCSRENFSRIVGIFESLGMKSRERFYAGEQAGWGAQVLEHPICKEVVFADVDLLPEESEGDFAHEGLQPKMDLGTVGLWVGLHGESILSAGLHHLAILVDFHKSDQRLPEQGIPVMPPFSSFPFLKQAFTQGETWSADKKRLDILLDSESINQEHHMSFSKNGAIGGHVEIIERNSGFMGFNQDSVSAIIKATDPRVQYEKGA